jgi:hypothetical protein
MKTQIKSLPKELVKRDFPMPKTKSAVTTKKKVVSRPKEKPLTAEELVGQEKPREFDGVVDNRRLPDADMPTHYMEGVLEIAPEGHGYLRPRFIPSVFIFPLPKSDALIFDPET